MRKLRSLFMNLAHNIPPVSLVMALFILAILSYISISQDTAFGTTKTQSADINQVAVIGDDNEEIQVDENISRTQDLIGQQTKRARRGRNAQLQQHVERIRDVDEEDWKARVDQLYYELLDGDPFELQQLGLTIGDDMYYEDGDKGEEYYEEMSESYQNRQALQNRSRDFIKKFGKSKNSRELHPGSSLTGQMPGTSHIQQPMNSNKIPKPTANLAGNKSPNTTSKTSPYADSSHSKKKSKKLSFNNKPNTFLYQIPGFQIFLYSAFLDAHHQDHRYIRVFGVQNRTQPTQVQCSVYTGKNTGFQLLEVHRIVPVYSGWPTAQATYLAYQYGYHITDTLWSKVLATDRHILQCWVETHGKVQIPFEIVPRKPGTLSKDVALCVKAIWGQVDNYRLIEWIEFQRLLGIVSITFYRRAILDDVDDKTAAILDFYERQGFIHVRRGNYMDTLGSYLKKDPVRPRMRHGELLMEQVYLVNINDCLYHYSKTHQFVLLVDIDEFLIPSHEESLTEMIGRLHRDLPVETSAYVFPTVWHFTQFGAVNTTATNRPLHRDSSKSYVKKKILSSTTESEFYGEQVYKLLHTQNYLKRTPILDSQPKSVIVSGTFITANWHGVHVTNDDLIYQGNYGVSGGEYGMVHHYRDGCKHSPQKCKEFLTQGTVDDRVSAYRESLAKLFMDTVKELHNCCNISVVK